MLLVCQSVRQLGTLSCPLHISWTLRWIFIKFHSNVPLCETACNTYNSATQIQCQSQSSRSWDLFLNEFRARPISPELFNGLSSNFTQMFLSRRQYAEPIIQLHGLKVNATVQGHGIYPWISCPLHISSTICELSSNFTLNVPFNKSVCRTHNSATQTQDQGTVQGHENYPWMLCPLYISWTLWAIFIKFHSNVPPSKSMCRTYGPATQTQGQCHTSRSWDLALNFVSALYLLNHLMDFHQTSLSMILSTSRFAEPITQLPRIKTKVTVQGHEIYPWMLCPLQISWTLWAIFIKFYQDVILSETVYRTYDLATQIKIQCPTSRSWDLSLNFVSAPYLLNPLNGFH